MLALPLIWLLNGITWLRNGWRRIFHNQPYYARFDLSGKLPEVAPSLPRLRRWLGEEEPLSLLRFRQQLKRIEADERAKGIILYVRDFAPGYATAQSLRDALKQFQSSGKSVIAYLFTPDTQSYFAVSCANQIFMPPSATLAFFGLRSEVLYLRDTLALLGIEAEVTAVSPYKAAGDQFTRVDMSPENREQLERLLDQRFAMLLDTIASDRKLERSKVEAAFDQAFFIGQNAVKAGLIDAVCYEDELEKRLQPQYGDKIAIYPWEDADGVVYLPMRHLQKRVVAVISLEGTIMMGSRTPMPPLFGNANTATYDVVSQALRKAEQNKRIGAVVLHVDSPGGDAYASDLIWREVLRVRQNKPVVVSMGNVAASGGYYVSACANAIVAQPSTLTGSIGVVSLRPIAADLLKRLQVHPVVLTRGERTGMLSPLAPPTEDERAAIREMVFDLYAGFKQIVREGRSLSEEQLDPIAGGRVWTGDEASKIGLVDQLGGLPQAVAKARELAGLQPDPHARLLVLRGSARDKEPPLPFGKEAKLPLDYASLQAQLEELLKPRLLTILPFRWW
jgi:signal peptide peptidase SppA, 36K type